MKKVCVLTTFDTDDPSYSLNLVARDQVRMLLAGGYEPVVIVNKGFQPGPDGPYGDKRVKLVRLHKAPASNEGTLPDNYEKEVDKMAGEYGDAILKEKIEVILTHDLISQPAALINNLAARKVAEAFSHVRWLHWVHSCFSSNVQSNVLEASKKGREKFPNSNVIFPNAYDRPRVARAFNVEEDDVLHCPHPTDILNFFGTEEHIAKLVEDKKLLDKDILMAYPCRLDRGKQPHYIIDVIAQLKRLGSSVSLVIGDFSSTGGDKVEYRKEMHRQAAQYGLDDTELIFLSEEVESFKLHAPRSAMRSLFQLTDVFMLPSVSETYSLVAQEAALCGNFLILNHDFAPMRSIYGESPKYYQFSGNIGIDGLDGNMKTEYGDKEAYMRDIACYIRYVVQNNRVLFLRNNLRRERSLQAVLRNHLEPMIVGDPKV